MSFYKNHVFFCTNQRTDGRACCQDHDAQRLRDYAKSKVKELGLAGKGKVRVSNAGCLDRCAEGPTIVVYPEAIWYTYKNEADIDEIVHEHLQNGHIVERLKLK